MLCKLESTCRNWPVVSEVLGPVSKAALHTEAPNIKSAGLKPYPHDVDCGCSRRYRCVSRYRGRGLLAAGLAYMVMIKDPVATAKSSGGRKLHPSCWPGAKLLSCFFLPLRCSPVLATARLQYFASGGEGGRSTSEKTKLV